MRHNVDVDVNADINEFNTYHYHCTAYRCNTNSTARSSFVRNCPTFKPLSRCR
jgi:hypothetical protein